MRSNTEGFSLELPSLSPASGADLLTLRHLKLSVKKPEIRRGPLHWGEKKTTWANKQISYDFSLKIVI